VFRCVAVSFVIVAEVTKLFSLVLRITAEGRYFMLDGGFSENSHQRWNVGLRKSVVLNSDLLHSHGLLLLMIVWCIIDIIRNACMLVV